MGMEKNSKEALKNILMDRDNWVVISHLKPDGDTLGSASAMVQIGLSLGKRVQWWGKDPLPERYSFLPCSDLYAVKDAVAQEDLDDKPLMIAIDISSIERGLKGMDSGDLVVVDHHGDNPCFGSVNWVDSEISSVGEMIYSLAESMGLRLTKGMAESIYVAIITDTGNLSFSNVTGETLRTVANLVDFGVVPSDVTEKLYHRDTPERLKLWGRAFERLRCRRKICYSYLRSKDFNETGTEQDDTESLINTFMRIKDAEVALLFVEDKEDVKVSLRSKGKISVQEIAHLWGGGGHICASGCRVRGSIDEVILHVVESITIS